MLQFDPKSSNLVTSVMSVIGVIKLWYTRQYLLTSSLDDSSCLTRSSRSCAGKCRVFIPSSVVPTRCRAICSRRSYNQTRPIRKKLAMTQVSLTAQLSFMAQSLTLPVQAMEHLCKPGSRLNTCIKMSCYQHRNSHFKDKTVSWPSYLYNGKSPFLERPSLYWDITQVNTMDADG